VSLGFGVLVAVAVAVAVASLGLPGLPAPGRVVEPAGSEGLPG
jgi:hypothetical protein